MKYRLTYVNDIAGTMISWDGEGTSALEAARASHARALSKFQAEAPWTATCEFDFVIATGYDVNQDDMVGFWIVDGVLTQDEGVVDLFIERIRAAGHKKGMVMPGDRGY